MPSAVQLASVEFSVSITRLCPPAGISAVSIQPLAQMRVSVPFSVFVEAFVTDHSPQEWPYFAIVSVLDAEQTVHLNVLMPSVSQVALVVSSPAFQLCSIMGSSLIVFTASSLQTVHSVTTSPGFSQVASLTVVLNA